MVFSSIFSFAAALPQYGIGVTGGSWVKYDATVNEPYCRLCGLDTPTLSNHDTVLFNVVTVNSVFTMGDTGITLAGAWFDYLLNNVKIASSMATVNFTSPVGNGFTFLLLGSTNRTFWDLQNGEFSGNITVTVGIQGDGANVTVTQSGSPKLVWLVYSLSTSILQSFAYYYDNYMVFRLSLVDSYIPTPSTDGGGFTLPDWFGPVFAIIVIVLFVLVLRAETRPKKSRKREPLQRRTRT